MQRKLIRLDNIVGAALMSLLPDILRWEFGLLGRLSDALCAAERGNAGVRRRGQAEQ